MKYLIISTTFSFITAIATQAFASDIEDYAGLPLYPENSISRSEDSVIDAEHEGYDGLPVTRKVYSGMRSAEIDGQEGYEGLPLVEFTRSGLLANQE